MKRLLILLFAAMMALTIAACSSTKQQTAPTTTPKPTETSAPPKATPPPATPAPTDTAKSEETKTTADASKTDSTLTATEAPKAEEAKAAAEAPKASDTPKSEPAKSAPEAPKAEEAKASSQPAPAAEAPKAAAPEAPQKPEVSPQGKKVLLVGREKASEDEFVANRLRALGFKVTLMIDREFTPAETKGYDLLYISQTLNSKIVKDGVMKDSAIPTVYVKNHGMFYLGFSSIEENANVNNVKSIDIVDGNSKVTAGLSGSVEIYKETGPKIGIGYGLPGKEAKIIATAPGDKSKATIYYYDKGSKADNGYEAKARISFFFLNNGMQENATEATWKMLENLVVWTLQN